MDFEGEDFLAEAERKAKQKFLREEVIELNFDSRLFTYHCESKKAADIDLWTFEELQECVREFKMKYRASQTFEEFEEKLKRDKENEKRLYEIPIRKVPKAVEELKLEEAKTFETRRESNISESDNDIYIFPVQKAPETELIVSKDLKLEVLEATVVQEGFFGSSYVVYTVTTSPLGWEVKRRFTEFKWLSEVLSHEFPGYYIPPLPDKKAHGNTEDDTILKRQRFLQRYMNSIISNSVFKSSPSLVLFLQQSSSKELKSSKDHNKKTKRQTLDQFVSLKGEIMCDVREQVMKFASINQYLNSAETLKKKLKRQSEEIIDDFRKLSKTLTSYAETVKQLSDIQEILDFNIGHKDVFRSINEALLEWSNHQLESANFVGDYFNMYFKFGYMELRTIKDLIKERDTALSVLRKTEGKETEKRKKARDMFGFYNHQCLAETERIILASRNQACEHFSELANNQQSHSMKLKAIWQALLDKLLSMSDRYSFFG